MITKKIIERSVNINDNITPITHQPIPEIQGHLWTEMNISQLYEQKSILLNRLNYLKMAHQGPIINQMQTAINKVQKIIDDKTINIKL